MVNKIMSEVPKGHAEDQGQAVAKGHPQQGHYGRHGHTVHQDAEHVFRPYQSPVEEGQSRQSHE